MFFNGIEVSGSGAAYPGEPQGDRSDAIFEVWWRARQEMNHQLFGVVR